MRLNVLDKLFCLFFLFGFYSANCQQRLAPDIYIVKFTDKNCNSFTTSNPSAFLSQRAIERRSKQRIQIDLTDLPVSKVYTDSLTQAGFTIQNTSKWINAVTIVESDTSKLKILNQFSFINHQFKETSTVQKKFLQKNKFSETYQTVSLSDTGRYGGGYSQIAIHNGNILQDKGFSGKGMLIAVLDGGFNNVKNYTSLQKLWLEKRVLLTRDFVDKTRSTFYDLAHGSQVLSVMAANMPNYFIGTAPDADYILLRSENAEYDSQFGSYEYPVEEFNWVAAAELADSIGADVINSSLGYSLFDDPTLNHTYAEMNGHTTIVSQGAEMAAAKGLVVVISAGNEGDNSWKYITAPADADHILTAGGIDIHGKHAYFSSYGPTSDGRIKPDVVAVGYQTFIQSSAQSFAKSYGTSYSAPIIAGLSACLWQACPNKTNLEIIDAIKRSSSQYTSPDTILGYGIPDYAYALYLLNPSLFPSKNEIKIYPNPFVSNFTVELGPMESNVSKLTCTDLTGKIISELELATSTDSPTYINFSDLSNYPKGLYILRIQSGKQLITNKIIKIH